MGATPPPGLDSTALATWYQQNPSAVRPATGYGSSPYSTPVTPVTPGSQTDTQQQLAGIGTSSTSSAYGIPSAIMAQPVDVSGFPPTVQAALAQAGIDSGQSWTAETLASAIAKISNPLLVSNLQEMLFYSGAFGVTQSILDNGIQSAGIQLGVFGAKDMNALGNVITTAAQGGSALGSYLTQTANTGKAQSLLDQVQSMSQAPLAVPNHLDDDATLKAEALSILGHDVSPDEYSRFRAAMDAQYVQGQRDASNAKLAASRQGSGLPGTGPGLPGLGSLSNALQDSKFLPDGVTPNPNYNPLTSQFQAQGAPGSSSFTTQADAAATAAGVAAGLPNQQAVAQAGGSTGGDVSGTFAGGGTQADAMASNPGMPGNPGSPGQYAPFGQQAQNAQDQSALGALNNAATATGTVNTYQQVASPGVLADQFLQTNNAADVAKQDVATRYEALLGLLKGLE